MTNIINNTIKTENFNTKYPQPMKRIITINKRTEDISSRQLEVLHLLASGLKNKEIADQLFVSEGTIKKHLYNLCQKMETNNRYQLLQAAKQIGIINL